LITDVGSLVKVKKVGPSWATRGLTKMLSKIDSILVINGSHQLRETHL
jgi:hypothetical protein